MHYSTNTADMGVGVTTRTVLRWNSCLSKIWLYAGIPVDAAILVVRQRSGS
jgi:hypothetical protein